MGRKKRAQWYLCRVLLLGQLLLTLFFTFKGISQPVYRFGMDITLSNGVYQVKKVIENGVAWQQGLRTGMKIVEIQGYDTQWLNSLSKEKLEAYLEKSSSLFTPPRVVLKTAEDMLIRLEPGDKGLGQNLSVVNRTFLMNSFLALAVLMAGLFFHAVIKDDGQLSSPVKLYFLFILFLAPAMQFSFFHTLWGRSLILFRYILLDLFGTVAVALFFLISLTFPVQKTRHRLWLFFLLLLPLEVKYFLILVGSLSLFGPSSYYIHYYTLTLLLLSVAFFITQYTHGSEGGKRSLRWIFSGMVATVFPYIIYLVILIALGSYITSSFILRAASILSNTGLIFFPLLLGVGLTRRNPFDVDKVLRWLFMVFLVVLLQLSIYLLLFLFFPDGPDQWMVFLMISLTGLTIPTLFHPGKEAITSFIDRGARKRRDRLEELGHFLTGSHTKPEIYGRVVSVVKELFSSSTVLFVHTTEVDGELVVDFSDKDTGETETISFLKNYLGDLRKESVVAENHSSRGPCIFSLYTEEHPLSYLVLGSRTDGDIFTQEDISSLKSLSYGISQAFENALLYERLFTTIQDLENEIFLRQDVEEQLRRELIENEVLLKEVHHRVKNNLTIISSLLNLQSEEINSPDQAIEAFQRSRDRVQAIALIHELLSSSASLAEVELSKYIKSLGLSMRSLYGNGKMIDLQFVISDDIMLDMEQAISFGLIYNEFFAKTIMHCFKEKDNGTIRVELKREGIVEQEEIVLSVGGELKSDKDGEEVYEIDFSREEELGLRLVAILTDQMKARVTGTMGPSGNSFSLHISP